MLSQLLNIRIFDVEAANRCNLRCRFCPRDQISDQGVMSRETFEQFLDHVPLHGTDSLAFVGLGEPLLNPNLPSFVGRAKERYPTVGTWVTTNAMLLTATLARRLLDAGLDTLDVSANGIDPASYEDMMRGAHFDRLLHNLGVVQDAIARSGSHAKLQINFVLSRENERREAEIRAFWQARGIEHFRIQPMHDRGGTIRLPGMTPRDRPGLNGKTCTLFEAMTFVTWRGDVLTCSHDIERRHKIGSVLTDTWQTLSAKKQAFIQNRCWPEMCATCTDPLRHCMHADLDAAARREIVSKIWSKVRSPWERLRPCVTPQTDARGL